MNKILTVSASPHIASDQSVNRMMYHVILSLVPAFLISLYMFGIGAVIVTAVSILSCVLFEMLIQKYIMHTEVRIRDGSAMVTGLLLAFNLPSNIPWWIIVLGSLFAIGVGKMAYGGLGSNPFNPALVGRVFLLVSFPVQMTSWPLPGASRSLYLDAATGATPLGILKEALRGGESATTALQQIPDHMHLFLGQMGGSLGEISAVALLAGFLWMLYKKIITWHIPVTMVGTIFVFTGILYLANPARFAPPVFQILTGGVMLGAIYMATDLVTSPMTKTGMVIYAVCIGLITVVIRIFGAYPEGVSFAILIMNAFVPLINKYIRPKRFGEEVKNG